MLIYGRNATGKTNLEKAITDICKIMYNGQRYTDTGVFLNADSKDEAASFSYEFKFENRKLVYRYARFSNQELKDEELIIDKKTIFSCNFKNSKFDFSNLKYINAKTVNTDVYLQSLDITNEELQEHKLPFLRWLINNVAFSNDSILIKLANYIRRMIMIRTQDAMLSSSRRINDAFYELLEKDADILKDLVTFLNDMGIECKLILQKLPDGQRELYFKHENLVPFYDTASSGTLALVDLYRRLIPKNYTPSFIYLDEYDAFYHYEMSEKVMNFFKRRYPKCQIIMTTHNTNLMTNRLMRPDCLFILSKTGALTPICNATQRELRKGHNLEKMYISGEFDKYE